METPSAAVSAAAQLSWARAATQSSAASSWGSAPCAPPRQARRPSKQRSSATIASETPSEHGCAAQHAAQRSAACRYSAVPGAGAAAAFRRAGKGAPPSAWPSNSSISSCISCTSATEMKAPSSGTAVSSSSIASIRSARKSGSASSRPSTPSAEGAPASTRPAAARQSDAWRRPDGTARSCCSSSERRLAAWSACRPPPPPPRSLLHRSVAPNCLKSGSDPVATSAMATIHASSEPCRPVSHSLAACRSAAS